MTRPSAAVGYLAATVAAVIFGTNGVIIKLLMDGTGLDGFQVTFFRVLGGGFLMGLVLFVRDRRHVALSDAGRALALEATEMLNSKVFAHPGLQQDKLEQLVTILTELRKTAGDFDTGGAPTKW